MSLRWRDLRTALASGTAAGASAPGETELRLAAVAAILRADARGEDELLLIRRAEHPLDPWSGHMAFPGGRVDPGDAGPYGAALRETREEVGIDLESRAELLGSLPEVPVIGSGRRLPMAIHPFVFGLPTPEVELHLNYEVEEALWVPLSHLSDRARRSSFLWHRDRASVHMPCCDFEGRRIWGLTLRMIDDLVGA